MAVRRLAPKEKQPASFAFSAENLTWAKAQIEKYPPGRQASAVIPVLWRVQEQHDGWVSEVAIRAVADLLDMAYIRVLEIATFYTMFQLEPVGKKAHVQVCGTTPCMLRGAGEIIDVCKHRIHHDPFHLSADGNFSWEEVECLGSCVNAPMVMIWKDTYEDLTAESFGIVLDGFETGNMPKPGPQNGRQFAAPLGGPRTLIKTDAINSAPEGKSQPALTDSEAKTAGAAANVRERPSPKPPMGDATATKPPKGAS
ncbi:MAG: NADH-quinone oxidoreductase subunit NuoE [Pseudomonadota bacterium]